MPRPKSIIIWITIAVVLAGAFTPAIPACAAPLNSQPGQTAVDSGGKGLLNILLDLLLGTLLNKLAPGLGDKIAEAPPGTTAAPASAKEVLGFYAEWWDTDTSSYTSMARHVDSLNAIVPFWATVRPDGSVSDRGGKDHASVANFARQSNLSALLLVNNAGQSGSVSGIHAVLADPGLRATAIENLEAVLRKYRLDGINIDFETVQPEDRDDLTAFMRELSARLKPQGYVVSIDVMPKTDESSDIAAAYDYGRLADYADKIIVMTYDNHGQWSAPGPVAGIDWTENSLKYALKYIPKSKLYLGLAGYGYDWSANNVASVDYPEVVQLAGRYNAAVQWDNTVKSNYFRYTGDDGTSHTVWYENSQSLKYKLDLVNSYDIAGVALWKLGEEDPDDWQLIKDKLKKNNR
ncbi:MAG: glycosyl hydrolase family 18 protein [Negativicutes bacterium]|nr:glycosyl hydrolase family 18 protein [Negativicutes bacterium]